MTWVPVTVPGIVLAFGLIWAYVGLVRLPFPFYGTIWILIIAVTITTITTGARTMNGSMVQISPELEEAARMHGASFAQTIRRVLLPLMTPATLSSWLILVRLCAEKLCHGFRAVHAPVSRRLGAAI